MTELLPIFSDLLGSGSDVATIGLLWALWRHEKGIETNREALKLLSGAFFEHDERLEKLESI